MEGEINKWTNYISGWQKRYLNLRGEILYYYEKKGENAKGKVHLAVSKIIENEENEFRFDINTGSYKYYFKTETKEEKQNWIQALKLAKFNADRNLLKPEGFKSDFMFNKIDSKDLPFKLQELLKNIETLYNNSAKCQKEIQSAESNFNESRDVSGNLQSLKAFITSNSDASSQSVQLLGSLINNLKVLSQSINSLKNMLCFDGKNNENTNVNLAPSEIKDSYIEESKVFNDSIIVKEQPAIVRSKINNKMLFKSGVEESEVNNQNQSNDNKVGNPNETKTNINITKPNIIKPNFALKEDITEKGKRAI